MYSDTDIGIRKCSISIASIQISAFYNPKGKKNKMHYSPTIWNHTFLIFLSFPIQTSSLLLGVGGGVTCSTGGFFPSKMTCH